MTRTIDQLNPRVQQHFHDEPLGDGWIAWNLKDATRYNALIDPLRVRRDADTADGRPTARLRMVPERRHSNLGNAVHGGIILSLIDVSLFSGARLYGVLNAGAAVTLDLNTQFIDAGKAHVPMDSVVEVLRETRRLIFLRGIVEQEASIHASNVMLYSTTAKVASRAR